VQQWDETKCLLRKLKVSLLVGTSVRCIGGRAVPEKNEVLKDISWDLTRTSLLTNFQSKLVTFTALMSCI